MSHNRRTTAGKAPRYQEGPYIPQYGGHSQPEPARTALPSHYRVTLSYCRKYRSISAYYGHGSDKRDYASGTANAKDRRGGLPAPRGLFFIKPCRDQGPRGHTRRSPLQGPGAAGGASLRPLAGPGGPGLQPPSEKALQGQVKNLDFSTSPDQIFAGAGRNH